MNFNIDLISNCLEALFLEAGQALGSIQAVGVVFITSCNHRGQRTVSTNNGSQHMTKSLKIKFLSCTE
jgi:hypothetical protein